MQNIDKVYEKTGRVIDITLKRAAQLQISDFVIASCTGKTVEVLLSRLDYFGKSGLFKSIYEEKKANNHKSENINYGFNIVCVTHQIGFDEPNQDEMNISTRKRLTDMGVKLLTATHLFGGVDRALRLQFKGVYPAEIVSSTLRMFGQGIKVCIEISVMAADAGLVKAYSNIIAFGGTNLGADSAAVICPAHSQDFFKTKVIEIITKPVTF